MLDAMRGEYYAVRIIVPRGLFPQSAGDIEPSQRVRHCVAEIQAEAPTIISLKDFEDIQVRERDLKVIGPGQQIAGHPHARGVAPILDLIIRDGPVDLASWEPDYGSLAEAQVRWEAAHGKKLTT